MPDRVPAAFSLHRSASFELARYNQYCISFESHKIKHSCYLLESKDQESLAITILVTKLTCFGNAPLLAVA
jgi:hypothetical protein